MPKEYEYSFNNFDKKEIIKKIKDLDGKHQGTYLFRVQVLIHPLNKKFTYVRVRDEGHRITMTYKLQNPKEKFPEELEVIIDNFDIGVNLLIGLGCKKKYYYEKIREIWKVKETEIVFDTNPGITDRMEVESKTKKELTEIVKELELKPEVYTGNKYKEKFGILIPKDTDLTFQNVKKELKKFVKKNMDEFLELVDYQLEKYDKLVN